MRFGHSRSFPFAIIRIGLVVAAANREVNHRADLRYTPARPLHVGAAANARLLLTPEAFVASDAGESSTDPAFGSCKATSADRAQSNGCRKYEKKTTKPINHFLIPPVNCAFLPADRPGRRHRAM
jgi:hypothetical protein